MGFKQESTFIPKTVTGPLKIQTLKLFFGNDEQVFTNHIKYHDNPVVLQMDKTLKLFIVGFITGLVIALMPLPGEVVGVDDPVKIIKQVFSGGATFWKIVYFTILVVTLPILVVEPLKKRLKIKPLFPLQFIVGNSCAMGIVTLILIVSTLI